MSITNIIARAGFLPRVPATSEVQAPSAQRSVAPQRGSGLSRNGVPSTMVEQPISIRRDVLAATTGFTVEAEQTSPQRSAPISTSSNNGSTGINASVQHLKPARSAVGAATNGSHANRIANHKGAASNGHVPSVDANAAATAAERLPRTGASPLATSAHVLQRNIAMNLTHTPYRTRLAHARNSSPSQALQFAGSDDAQRRR
jgi:hypothetical protein